MPVFAYQGLNDSGHKVNGIVEADSAKGARTKLRLQGVFPTEVEEGETEAKRARSGEARITPTELALVSRQLATLMAARIPVVECLEAVGEQTDRPGVERILSHIRDAVTQGSALGDAMAEHPASFPPLFVGMVRAGEAAGALDLVLERLALYSESQVQLQARVRNALAYPVLMFTVAGGIVFFLLSFVVPKVTKIFANQHESLPLPTRFLLAISNSLAEWWWLVVALLASAIIAAMTALRRPGGRLWLDHKLLTLPVLGPLFTRIAVGRFSRTLATLLSGGIPLLEALELASNTSGNTALGAAVELARIGVREGGNLSELLRDTGLFPPLLVRMIAVGERSGELEPMLIRVADAYEQEVEGALATLTSILEPAMIVVMGGLVLFIVLAVLLPIFEINSLVG
ncbi:MAG: type II secretion system inner membrane protein GspF [Deltaproteobacteria bacterium]